MDAIGVVVAGAEATDVHVPEVEAAVPDRVERDSRDRVHVVVSVEEKQLDARRLLREEGEVDPPIVDGRPERLGLPRLERREQISD
jgi:hypothetical protein